MKWNIFLSTAVVLLLAGIIFIILGYYQPKIKSYEIQVANLTSEVSRLEQTVSTREQTISSQEARISTQTAQISTLESEKSGLQTEVSNLKQTVSTREQTISSQKAQISTQEVQISTLALEKSKLQTDLSSAQGQTESYKGQVNTLTSQLTSSQKRLDNVLGITVNQYYQWSYQGSTWQWELAIPLSVYVEYREAIRPLVGPAWANMAKDPNDDYYIDQMIQKITDAALRNRFTEVQKLNFVVGFVQSLPYTVDIVTTPYNEYPRYPVETLFDRGGDCEDTSILVAALLDRLGYDVALLLLKDARHVAVGVAIPNASGSYYTYKDKKYFYLETTGDGWEIGEIPSSITNLQAYIYPLRS